MAVAVLFASRLPYPLDGDQALFLAYARQLAEGGRLYVDLWDTKQPGIFWFFALAGGLFGFDAVGVHLFEGLWMAAAAVLLWGAARCELRHAPAIELVPLLTAGLYYAWASAWFLTQLEILVTLPLALCLAAGVQAARQPHRAALMHALSGLGLGLVLVFKLVLLPVPLALWAVSVAWGRRHGRLQRHFWLGTLLPWLAGALLPLAAMAGRLAQEGAWPAFAWTSFAFPALALGEIPPKPLAQLFHGAAWLGALAVPVAALWWRAWRRPGRAPLRLIEWQSLAWLLSGLAVIGAQRLSWWSYHYLLVLAPLGLLAACAIDRLGTAGDAARHVALPRRAAGWVALALAIMFVLPVRHTLACVRGARDALHAVPGAGLSAYRDAIRPGYRQRLAEAAFLRADAGDRAPAYVFGDPNWLLASGRAQALPINGWSWEVMPMRLWVDFEAQFRARPPAWLYLHPAEAALLQQKAPALGHLIAERYQHQRPTFDQGAWYRLKPAP